ncbi:unnamed protein product, partial [Discosporangium mesarthrocarpum]
ELERVTQWKLRRGKDRPNLLKFVRENPPDKVQTSSSFALSTIPPRKPGDQGQRVDPKAAIQALAAGKGTHKLRGVGPATASAVLAAYSGGCPFMADEV